MPSALSLNDLAQFTGDIERYRHPLNHQVIYTPGVHYLAEQAGAYWLIDAIASYFGSPLMQRAMEKENKQSPEEAYKYNQWAWLVSNTEGDFNKAVKRSQHSLELQPESPSYMDTLGRCYYAVGDLDSAIKVQRKAVALHPHLMVMQRQLKLFEDELQELGSGGAAE